MRAAAYLLPLALIVAGYLLLPELSAAGLLGAIILTFAGLAWGWAINGDEA